MCAYAWLPAAAVVLLVLSLAGVEGEGRLWGLLTLTLLPIAMLLALVDVLLRHRWIGTPESRSDPASVVGGMCLGLGVVAVIAGAAALVSGMGWLAALSGAVLAGCILLGRHEMARTLPPDPDDPPEDHSSIFNSMDNLTSGP